MKTLIAIMLMASSALAGDIADSIARYKAAQAAQDNRPIVIGHSIPGCPPCMLAKKWEDLPFKLHWVENSDRAEVYKTDGYPIFEYPHRDGQVYGHWGKDGPMTREVLIKNWALDAEPDPQKYSELIAKRVAGAATTQQVAAPATPAQKTALCQCGGSNKGVCLCLQEIRQGIRTKPCGCSRSRASEHTIDANGKPTGATGKYFPRQSAIIRAKPGTVC